MATDHGRLQAYYDSFDEWGRLETPEGVIEHRRTLDVLRAHLTSGCRVLDLGGGPGRYSAYLPQLGCRVVLADISPVLLAVAREKLRQSNLLVNIEAIDEVNAINLDLYASDSFDAVVACGPFYHLVSHEERCQAAAEIHRVLRPDGLAFVAYVPRLSGLIGLIQRAAARPEQVSAEVLREAADTGVFHNTSVHGFQEGYYPWPGDVEALFEAKGFQIVDAVSLRSIAHRLGEETAALDAARRAEVDRLIDALGRRPEVVAMCGHVLMIARKVNSRANAEATSQQQNPADGDPRRC